MNARPKSDVARRAGLAAAIALLAYPLSIGPVWFLLTRLRDWQIVSGDLALGLGFIPYIPLLMLCDRIPLLQAALDVYLRLFSLGFTDFIPG
jgi:hypothetical protein